MRIKIGSGLLPQNLLVIILITIIVFVPSNILRIILGLPLVLFFPGHALMLLLFPKKEQISNVERIALSFGTSIVVVSLICLILNYTPLGITLESTLYSVAGFEFLASVIAWFRLNSLSKQDRFGIEFQLRLPGWDGSRWDRVISIVLVIAVLGSIGMLSYAIAAPKVGEKFTEFYVLGRNGMATDYPTEFVVEGNEVILVKYGDSEIRENAIGSVIVGIVNHEHEKSDYLIKLLIGGEQVAIYFDGDALEELGPVTLAHEEKWEHEIGFAPEHVGDHQKVEFLLYKDGVLYFEEPPYLWIDSRVQG